MQKKIATEKVSIKMLSTRAGSEDGIYTKTYNKDEEYDIDKSLADVFLREKWAENVKPKPEKKIPAATKKTAAEKTTAKK